MSAAREKSLPLKFMATVVALSTYLIANGANERDGILVGEDGFLKFVGPGWKPGSVRRPSPNRFLRFARTVPALVCNLVGVPVYST
jgi:hypothetical protein